MCWIEKYLICLVVNFSVSLSLCHVFRTQMCMCNFTISTFFLLTFFLFARYMFDEPSSYLDIKQRLRAAEVIRSLLTPDCYVVAVEHDLSVLDYLSDFICCLYGKPSMYGVVTMPSSVREGQSFTNYYVCLSSPASGINIFLDGFIPTENLRFREESLSFKMVETAEEILIDKTRHYSYPAMTKTLGSFKLTVEAGSFTDSEIIVMLGENGTGKTTFVRLLAGDTPDEETDKQSLAVSLKPQTISPKFPGTVRMLLLKQIKQAFMHPQFQTDVLKPMSLEAIMDQDVKTLSGGELQRVAIVLALGMIFCLCLTLTAHVRFFFRQT